MTHDLPGEKPPLPELPSLRQELTFATREAIRLAMQSPARRREIFLEAWEIMLRPQKYDQFQQRCAEIILRAACEASMDYRHLTEGLTTALKFLKVKDEPTTPEGGSIIVTS